MLPKHPDQYPQDNIELEAWIRHLVDERVPEGPRLDYKQTISLQLLKDKDTYKNKIEAAKDISSFANEVGGTLIYGIPEDRQSDEIAVPSKPYGIEPIHGLESPLENIYVDSISPKLVEWRIRKVHLTEYPGKVVYVVWTPESWLGPHMVHAFREKRYYRRGQLRAVAMDEHEVRARYERTRGLQSAATDFLQSQEQLFLSGGLQRSFGDRTSNYIACPLLLDAERVDLYSQNMQNWLSNNGYQARGGFGVEWVPCAKGVEAESTGKRYAAIYSGGAISCWQETTVRQDNDKGLLLVYKTELAELKAFLAFASKFYQNIDYYAPLLVRFSIYGLLAGTIKISTSDFRSDTFSLRAQGDYLHRDMKLSSSLLFSNPDSVLNEFGNKLFQAFGLYEAPKNA